MWTRSSRRRYKLCVPAEHVWSSWTTEQRDINGYTDPTYKYVRRCYECGAEEEL